jgi:hypothetical protein
VTAVLLAGAMQPDVGVTAIGPYAVALSIAFDNFLSV